MKQPFKVGDRVKVCATILTAPIETKGKVAYVTDDGMLQVVFDKASAIGNHGCVAHPMQCRRLKPRPAKKEKKEARIVYLNVHDVAELPDVRLVRAKDEPSALFSAYREVLPNEVTVTRESLGKAWDEKVSIQGQSYFHKSVDSEGFIDFCRALGLPQGEK